MHWAPFTTDIRAWAQRAPLDAEQLQAWWLDNPAPVAVLQRQGNYNVAAELAMQTWYAVGYSDHHYCPLPVRAPSLTAYQGSAQMHWRLGLPGVIVDSAFQCGTRASLLLDGHGAQVYDNRQLPHVVGLYCGPQSRPLAAYVRVCAACNLALTQLPRPGKLLAMPQPQAPQQAQLYTYCFVACPDETWRHGPALTRGEAAMFTLLTRPQMPIEQEYTEAAFQAFREALSTMGITLREITREVRTSPETVL